MPTFDTYSNTFTNNNNPGMGGDKEPISSQVVSKHWGGTVQMDGKGGLSVREATTESYTPDNNPKPSNGIITEARNGSRKVTGADITPNSIINIGGYEVSINAAVAAGLVVRDNQGNYVAQSEVSQNDGGKKNEQDHQQPTLSNEAEQLIGEMLDSVQPSEVTRAVRVLSEGTEIDDETIGRAASQLNLEPEQVRGKIGRIRAAFEGQAKEAVSDLGLDPMEVFEWAYAERPEAIAEAIQEHTSETRSTEGYKEIAQDYLANMDRYKPEAIVNALPKEVNPKVIMDNDRPRVLLDTQHGQITWATAVKMGLVESVSQG